MGFFKTATSKHQDNLTEEYLYGVVSSEMSNGVISQGLYAKAVYEAEGDEQKATARYIKLRVDSVRAEAEALVEANEELERETRQLAATQSKAVDAPRTQTPAPSKPLPKPSEPFSIAGRLPPAEISKFAAYATFVTCLSSFLIYPLSSLRQLDVSFWAIIIFTAFMSICSYLLWREAWMKRKARIGKEQELKKAGIPTKEEWIEYARQAKNVNK